MEYSLAAGNDHIHKPHKACFIHIDQLSNLVRTHPEHGECFHLRIIAEIGHESSDDDVVQCGPGIHLQHYELHWKNRKRLRTSSVNCFCAVFILFEALSCNTAGSFWWSPYIRMSAYTSCNLFFFSSLSPFVTPAMHPLHSSLALAFCFLKDTSTLVINIYSQIMARKVLMTLEL